MKRKKTSAAGFGDRAVEEVAAPPKQTPSAVGGAATHLTDDPILIQRLEQYDGPPIDLDGVPLHRRPQLIEDALDAWEAKTVGGPCAFCGTRTARVGMGPYSYLDPDTPPQFTQRSDGHAACDWCRDYLIEHNVEELREVVFNAIAGTTGIDGWQRRSHQLATPMAHEEQAGASDGTPWSHITLVQRRAIEMRAAEVVHPSRYVRTQGAADRVRIPGISTPVHTADSLPRPPMKYADLGAASRLAAENLREYARLKEQRKRQEKKWKAHCDWLIERDKKLEAMEPDEQARYLADAARNESRRAGL